jgi:hypothetical protein
MPSFARAAVRHCHDGQQLANGGMHISADHLAGLGVECAMKALLLSVAGASAGPLGIEQRFVKHGSKLRNEVIAYLQGPTSSTYFAPILLQDPFGAWDVSDRYEDGRRYDGGAVISSGEATALLAVGHALVAQLQTAQTSGIAVGL